MSETKDQMPEPTKITLENGEPVLDFSEPGDRLDLGQEFELAPTGAALIRLASGQTIAANRRAMVILDTPNERGIFTKNPKSAGTITSKLYPDGLPEVIIGERWLDIDVAERAVFAPCNAFTPMPLAPEAVTPGMGMFESAQGILREFEASQLPH